MQVQTSNKEHSVEGHTYTGTLKFRGQTIWGPHTCHDNTQQLARALQNADWRFSLELDSKEKTIEGHTRYISVTDWNGNLVLDRLSTHDNMDTLAEAITGAVAGAGGPP
ncbi:hypothetical protein ASPFODRAFT_40993 [Aspergillus luchuensis CBS 106.47]|uniref:Uncharacterized protein n=1 Tax=Aspergillus luchuensis (strain CBS 106.47) TaxID=1137211 RepID=A0A1M3TV43_ASPLC|nr:hypothetical protein ASPFODRAFT_40993 [Aspergillus luchuensis CBS 106.47]